MNKNDLHQQPDALPVPEETERERSARLASSIAAKIAVAGGWISFDHYMQEALYSPGMSYCSADGHVFGAGGDFVTAPELGSLFARTLALQCASVLNRLGGGDILEFGGGSGALMAELMLELDRLGKLPERYRIIELSASMRARQRTMLLERAPHCAERVEWLDSWPSSPWHGVALANEVLDAMPVRCFSLHEGEVFERGVSYRENAFVWSERPADPDFSAAVLAALPEPPDRYPDGYQSELNPSLAAWIAGLSENFAAGAALLIDYGDLCAGRYHPARAQGTLRAYYRHRTLNTPFWYPGLCDLTADVDFSGLSNAAVSAGFEIAALDTQANMLLAAGLEEVFAQSWEGAKDTQQQLRLAQEAKQLTLPGEMGERFRAILLSRKMDL